MSSDIVRVTRRLDIAALEAAYRQGEFPMAYPERGMITWHHPKTRAVLPLDGLHVSRSLARVLQQHRYQVSFDEDFEGVMRACADRPGPSWITDEFVAVYSALQKAGKAHSVEIRMDGVLAGGVYGVQLGGAFFAESKFHRVRDMSKVALAELVRHLRGRGFGLLEVQYVTPHLARLGVVEIGDREYGLRLRSALALGCSWGSGEDTAAAGPCV